MNNYKIEIYNKKLNKNELKNELKKVGKDKSYDEIATTDNNPDIIIDALNEKEAKETFKKLEAEQGYNATTAYLIKESYTIEDIRVWIENEEI